MPNPSKPFPLAVIVTLSVILVLLTAIALLISGWASSHPSIAKDAPKRNFARVALLMDFTPSLSQARHARIRQIVEQQIIPYAGIDDTVVGYDVQPGHAPLANNVFGFSAAEQPPRDPATPPAAILRLLRARTVPARAALYPLIRELTPLWPRLAEVNKGWTGKIQSRRSPAGGSNICGGLTAIREWLMAPDSRDPDAERWLFVLSDLQQEGSPEDCPVLPFPAEIHIVLVFSQERAPRPGDLMRFFGRSAIDLVPLSMASGGELLPPNPLAGLASLQAPTLQSSLLDALRGPVPPIAAGCIVAIWLGCTVWWLTLRPERRPPTPLSPGRVSISREGPE